MFKSEYSRRATKDARTAMAMALARYMRGMSFDPPGFGPFNFAEVYEEWPSYAQRYVSPSAMVMPSEWNYDSARTTPTLMEDTWEPKGVDGKPLRQPGWGLFKLADIDANFEVRIRAAHAAERELILKTLEVAFAAQPDVTSDTVDGAVYGIYLNLDEYYQLQARFAIQNVRLLDTEESAMKEQWEASVTLSGQAPHVTIGPVRPMSPRVVVREEE